MLMPQISFDSGHAHTWTHGLADLHELARDAGPVFAALAPELPVLRRQGYPR